MRKIRWTRDDSELTLLSLPTVIWYIAFCFLPMFGVIIAFKDYRIHNPGRSFFYNLMKSKTVGFDNFKFLFTSSDGWLVIRLTLIYSLIFLVLGLIIPVVLSIMMSLLHSETYGKLCQTMMFLPHFLSWVVVSYFVFSFLSPDRGLMNTILASLDKETYNWYMEPSYWPYILIFLSVWKSMGFGMVVYLAAITSINSELYEAAFIDGGSKWQQVKYITIPHLKYMIIMMLILNMGGLIRSDFGLFYQIPRASNSLYDVTNTIDVYIYNMLKTQANPNMASAAAFLQSIISMLLVLGSNWIVRKIDKDSAII